MSSRLLSSAVVLFSLIGILKASCPKVLSKGRIFLPSNCNCSTLDPDIQMEVESAITTRVVPAFYTVVFILGLPANAIALWVLIFKSKKMPSTILLINLATADLLFMMVLPFKITYHFMENNWIFGEVLCRIVTAVFFGNMYCSVLFLTAITIDRYIGIVHPFCAKGLRDWRCSTCSCMVMWLVVITAVSGFTFVPQTKGFINPERITCHEIWVICTGYDWYMLYFLGLFIAGLAIPSVVIFIGNGLILVTLAKKRENYRRVIGLISLILLVFILCFTPSNVLLVLHYLETVRESHNKLYSWYTMALPLLSLNSCIDPFIYCFASNDFWTLVKETLCISSEGNNTSSESTKRSKLTSSSEKEILRTEA